MEKETNPINFESPIQIAIDYFKRCRKDSDRCWKNSSLFVKQVIPKPLELPKGSIFHLDMGFDGQQLIASTSHNDLIIE